MSFPIRSSAATTHRPVAPVGQQSQGQWAQAPGLGEINNARKVWVHYGQRGGSVRTIQKAVGTKVDGKFGTRTRDAVKAFQKANNLKPDGVVGEKTLSVIRKSPDKTKTPLTQTPAAKTPAAKTPAATKPAPTKPAAKAKGTGAPPKVGDIPKGTVKFGQSTLKEIAKFGENTAKSDFIGRAFGFITRKVLPAGLRKVLGGVVGELATPSKVSGSTHAAVRRDARKVYGKVYDPAYKDARRRWETKLGRPLNKQEHLKLHNAVAKKVWGALEDHRIGRARRAGKAGAELQPRRMHFYLHKLREAPPVPLGQRVK